MKQLFGLGFLVLLVVGFGVLVASSGSSGANCGYGRGSLSQKESEKRWVEYNAKRQDMEQEDKVRTESYGEHVEVFYTDDDVLELQYQINKWLAENPGVEIISRTQSSSGEYFKSTMVLIWYRRVPALGGTVQPEAATGLGAEIGSPGSPRSSPR